MRKVLRRFCRFWQTIRSANVNKNTVTRTQSNLKLPGFQSYFKGKYDKYFRYTPQENLYTKGTEYKLESNGRLYKGYYHIHVEKGPMVGRQHTKKKLHNVM